MQRAGWLRVVVAVVLSVAILSPLAQLARTQQPWNCFQLTIDEGCFLHGIVNWSSGTGFRYSEGHKLFDPTMTVGSPLAWGSAGVRALTGEAWPQAARLWVHLCFGLLCLLVAWLAAKVGRSPGSWLVALGFFGFAVSRTPGASYTVYGVLGEMPGAVAAWLSLLAIGCGRFWPIAGALAVGSYFLKPSFVLLVPAVCAAAAVLNPRRGLVTAAVAAVAGGGLLVAGAWARGQGLGDYVAELFVASRRLSLPGGDPLGLFEHWFSAGPAFALLMLAVVATGAVGRVTRTGRLSQTPAELGAWVFFLLGCATYLVAGSRPVAKQWVVFCLPALGMLAVRLGAWLGPWLSDRIGRGVLGTAALGCVAVWLLNVPGLQRQRFRHADEAACPVKEQIAINRIMREKIDRKDAVREDFAVVAELSSSYFTYELGAPAPVFGSWAELTGPGKRARWVAGDRATLESGIPSRCRVIWKGSQMALAECGA